MSSMDIVKCTNCPATLFRKTWDRNGGFCSECMQIGDIKAAELLKKEACKDHEGKVALDLLPFEALEEVAWVLHHSLTTGKYEAFNWKKGTNWRYFVGASLRHIFKWARGEDKDPETGLSHLAHAVCDLLFLIHYQLHALGTDNRQSP